MLFGAPASTSDWLKTAENNIFFNYQTAFAR